MKITEYKKKDGSVVYRSSIYLGIDSMTGKKVKTTISARTKRELNSKAIQAKVENVLPYSQKVNTYNN